MRAIARQICRVCGAKTSSKAEMEEHIAEFHGNNWQPASLSRAEDQRQFKGHLQSTPWGQDLR